MALERQPIEDRCLGARIVSKARLTVLSAIDTPGQSSQPHRVEFKRSPFHSTLGKQLGELEDRRTAVIIISDMLDRLEEDKSPHLSLFESFLRASTLRKVSAEGLRVSPQSLRERMEQERSGVWKEIHEHRERRLRDL